MAHEFTGSNQQARWIINLGTKKEPDIYMRCKRIDITEGGITYTSGRMAVMQNFANIVPASPHDLEPMSSYCSQFTRMRFHPILDLSIALDRIRQEE